MDSPPKVFISYSWSSIPHREWVKDLAHHLVDCGIDVVLDIWELDLGHDTNHFMERIVNDKNITKTLIIADKTYTEKANQRSGGVGVETQIISKEVYDSAGENKFIAVIAEKNEIGSPYIPTFYTSRMYVDLSTNDAYSENLETLIRAIYGKPLHQKPPLGRKPSFLDQQSSNNSSSRLLYNRATTFLKEGKVQAVPALREYFSDSLAKLESYRIIKDASVLFDEQVIDSISSFRPHRDEILQVIQTSLSYSGSPQVEDEIHNFLEGILPYTTRPENISHYNTADFDNFVFFAKELFLNVVGIFLKEQKFSSLDRLLKRGFYFLDSSNQSKSLHDYSSFTSNCSSLHTRNQRLNLGRMSPEADLLKERSLASPLSFENLMQADFTLLVRSRLLGIPYWSDTLVYLDHYPRPFEIFVRAASREYFERVRSVFGADTKADLEGLAEDNAFNRPFNGRFLDVKGLLNVGELCTRP
ncbi:toll/interleukin-1 receptor domain-containing protein [Pseudomonas sp. AN3A02]|uniref:toll/interleukin-1 receptor domain-containing protein n=1 Tax=Pseudomonas sp. AN3A02 TaxID=2719587 RepID=UPI00142FF983|nr:toll/interleukin-1 receptor domain-containing protein [Pseudomonas sp. AN3A02]NIL20050.1 TIR domain-containing protein [Pseudomonas sp. AN3A02]